ncbi:DUF2867 domain-containing protein [Desulfovibrio ferrophilus]|uniref:DUF2867 domain-containing protein n=1 Tax=Desulfovibrio ferrophilus TaxID=241368 RepID=A0A2Z6AXK7_9BACT|nr:DUF2867 domain-containing protein [Desulfovibrio ferrophilus]BBD07987.1 uncharacterized protein DFE_1261 [Desulfovibrio ferrophilus]
MNADIMRLADNLPELNTLLDEADHVDMKSFDSKRSLSDFIARMVSYEPGWLKLLYMVRKGLAKLLGLSQVATDNKHLTADDIDFTPGAEVSFFTTSGGAPDHYWIGEASDKHLKGYIGVVAVPNSDGSIRFNTFTIVHYQHWTGPIYFNLIRPFHHIIVHFMGRHAAEE